MKRPLPRLLAVTDANVLAGEQLVRHVEQLSSAAVPGSFAVLLRDHELGARVRLRLGQQLREVTRATQQELWVADRIDLALLLDADGLHLGEGSVSAERARRLFAGKLSRAWHRSTAGEADRAELSGVDALLLSPIFAARKGRPALGARALAELAGSLGGLGLPARVFALGGVAAAEVGACFAAGAWGAAAIGAALGRDGPALLRALGISRGASQGLGH